MQRQRPSRHRSDPVKLTLTALPVRFKSDHVVGGELPYEGREQLDGLRSRYSATHVFHRTGNSVLTVPLTEDAEALGETTRLKLNEHALGCRLVRESLVRYFATLPYVMKRRRSSIVLLATSRDMIAGLLAKAPRSGLEGLHCIRRTNSTFDCCIPATRILSAWWRWTPGASASISNWPRLC